MKILVFSIVDLKKSAHNSRLHQFLKFLSSRHEITVLCLNDWWKEKFDSQSEDYNKSFEQLFQNVKIEYILKRKISPVLQDFVSGYNIKKILTEIKFSDYDLFFNYNGLYAGYQISRHARKLQIPVIYDIADDLPEMIATSPQIPPGARYFGKKIGRWILDKNISTSDQITITTDIFKSVYHIPEPKSILIPNGVDIQLFVKTDSFERKNELKLQNSFVIGHVGVMREWLDFHPLFTAIKDLTTECNVKLLLVGGGAGYDSTVHLAESYGILDQVIFTGTIPYNQIPEYIGCMDVCTVPFKNNSVAQNSVPLKLFEYMACEKPVICTNVKAIKDIFHNNIYFVSTTEQYKGAIIKLLKDDRLRKEMGIQGRKIIEENFQWDVLSCRLEQTMIQLCERK